MRKALASAGVVVITGLACFASPLTGMAYADPIPTAGEAALSDFYSAVPAAAELDGVAAAGVGAAADVEITGVCVATFPACAAGALGIGGALLAAKFGPSVIKWAFGGSHPAPGALSTQTLAGIGVSVIPDDSNVGGYGPHWDAQYSASGNAPNGYAWTHFTNMKVYTTFVESGDGSVYGGIATSNSTGLVHESDVGSTSTRATIHNSCYWLSAANGSSYMVGYSGDVSSGAIHSYCNGSIAGMGDRGPGAGSVTVTGHCYNAATGAADGTVAGSSSWSGSDTTIPDTTLPGCPSGDGLGGINITGTGSASGVAVTTTPNPTKYGSPFGTGTGPITVDNPWLPSECEAQNANCYTTWQHLEHSHWVDVDASTVPDNYANDYRCELKSGSGAALQVMPTTACPAPGAVDDTTPTDEGDPIDGVTHIDGGTAVDCFPHGWALLFNPIDFVMKPAECAIVKTIEPDTAHMAKLRTLATDVESRQPVATLKAGVTWVQTAFSGASSGACSLGWTVHFGPPIGDFTVLSCNDPIVGVLRTYRALFEAVVYVAFLGPLAWWAWRTYAPGSQGDA